MVALFFPVETAAAASALALMVQSRENEHEKRYPSLAILEVPGE
jgi:hypothetical protein